MRSLALRALLLLLPVMIVVGVTGEARAQAQRAWGVGVGIGYGSYGGPGWGRFGYGPFWGPGWGAFMPYYPGFYGNGLSMYGPPVPTGKPVPGVFGGADADLYYYRTPRVYPGYVFAQYGTFGNPGSLPPGVVAGPGGEPLPPPMGPPVPELDKPAPFEVEVRLPKEDAKVFINGVEAESAGAVRQYATPARPTAEPLSYDIRAEWTDDKGLKTGHTKKVTGRPGEKVVVEFK